MDEFDLENFLPYLLNRAAEQASVDFQKTYKSTYGILRTEWRVLFHLGRYGEMTAREVCTRGGLHKTKVSRAVSGLEAKRFVARTRFEDDRRFEILSLTPTGKAAYNDLQKRAKAFHEELAAQFTQKEAAFLIDALKKLKLA